MSSGQGEYAFTEANGADATRGERGVGPLFDGRPTRSHLPDQLIDKRLLTLKALVSPRAAQRVACANIIDGKPDARRTQLTHAAMRSHSRTQQPITYRQMGNRPVYAGCAR